MSSRDQSWSPATRRGTHGLRSIIASRLGAAAVDRLLRGECGVLVGLQRGEIVPTALREVADKQKPLDPELFELARSFAR